ncbi:MAG: CvpA family protein [Campylobacterales bacterium]|nr:CvpA family protein [Campylobacterales bacterium]
MDFITFDLIIIGLILFLSLKGLVNGFTKELFNFIGLIGGIFVASRMNLPVGQFINENLYPITNEPALKLIGFVATLLIIWVIFSLIASLFNRYQAEEPNFFSRLLGYVMTSLRYVAVFALIVVGIQKSEFLTQKLQPYYQDSVLFPTLSEAGSLLLNVEAREATTAAEANQTKEKPINLNFKIDENQTQL